MKLQLMYKCIYKHLLFLQLKGKKWELQKTEATFSTTVDKLKVRVFGGKRETFLMHQLKKLLSTEARKQARKNLPDYAATSYSDYSKGKCLES